MFNVWLIGMFAATNEMKTTKKKITKGFESESCQKKTLPALEVGCYKVDNQNTVDKGANMVHGHQKCCDTTVSTLLVRLTANGLSCYI